MTFISKFLCKKPAVGQGGLGCGWFGLLFYELVHNHPSSLLISVAGLRIATLPGVESIVYTRTWAVFHPPRVTATDPYKHVYYPAQQRKPDHGGGSVMPP